MTSPNATASATVPALAFGPAPATRSVSCSGCRDENMTGCPAFAKRVPSAPPSRPEPIVAILSGRVFCAHAANGVALKSASAVVPRVRRRNARRPNRAGAVLVIDRLFAGEARAIIWGVAAPARSRSRQRLLRRLNMLRAEPHADDPRRDARQEGHCVEQPQRPRRTDRLVGA